MLQDEANDLKFAPRDPWAAAKRFKMIIDVDGMGFSARFLALFNSGAAVIKSTIYREYASDWLEPWVHFIPLSLGASLPSLWPCLPPCCPSPVLGADPSFRLARPTTTPQSSPSCPRSGRTSSARRSTSRRSGPTRAPSSAPRRASSRAPATAGCTRSPWRARPGGRRSTGPTSTGPSTRTGASTAPHPGPSRLQSRI